MSHLEQFNVIRPAITICRLTLGQQKPMLSTSSKRNSALDTILRQFHSPLILITYFPYTHLPIMPYLPHGMMLAWLSTEYFSMAWYLVKHSDFTSIFTFTIPFSVFQLDIFQQVSQAQFCMHSSSLIP